MRMSLIAFSVKRCFEPILSNNSWSIFTTVWPHGTNCAFLARGPLTAGIAARLARGK